MILLSCVNRNPCFTNKCRGWRIHLYGIVNSLVLFSPCLNLKLVEVDMVIGVYGLQV